MQTETQCVDDGTWVCDYCHNLWDKEYHPDFCDEDCPDYMEDLEVDTHDIPEPTEQYDIDVAIRGRSDLPNPHAVNSSGQYVDSTNTIRESCGCSEANVLGNNHNVCTVIKENVN